VIKRLQAWNKYFKPSPEQLNRLQSHLKLSFEMPQLASKASVDNMLADLTKEGFQPNVIIFDTFARSFVGLDENSQKDVGMWIENADRLRQLGYTVIFLHHTKKNTEFGVQYRGSTAIMGAMDTAMTLVRSEAFTTLTVTKQKDHDEGAPIRFKRIIVPLGASGEGSCVLVTAPLMDERFAEADHDSPDIVKEVIEEPEFGSDRARARALAEAEGISEEAARQRILRRKDREPKS
jgi:hypothetical protein